MNLKEAFRYQNKLQTFTEYAEGILSRDSNVTKVENTYLYRKVDSGANDETVESVPTTEYYDKITELARFLVFLLECKIKLSSAIREAKNSLPIDMDSEVSNNTTRQSVAGVFKHLNELRSSEQTIPNGGTGYRFNTDGNQVSYKCDVRKVTTINYDCNVIRDMLNKLNKVSDETSSQIDLCLVTSKVSFEPPFDVNSSFIEAFEDFNSKK